MLSRSGLVSRLCALCLSGIAVFVTPAFAQPPDGLKIVELYTSQSCPHAPWADRKLAGISGLDNVLALTLPVTYWDFFGWKDTMAEPVFDDRQKAYVESLDGHWLNTPQAVLNGSAGMTGKELDGIESRLAATTGLPPLPVRAAMDGKLEVGLPDPSSRGSGPLMLTFVAWDESALPVPVAGGSNAGRVLHYTNVVRVLETEPVGRMSSAVAFSAPDQAGGLPCAFLLQERDSMAIIAAGKCPAMSGSAVKPAPTAARVAGRQPQFNGTE